MSSRKRRIAWCVFAGAFLVLAMTGAVAAHVVKQAGPYTLEIGWQHEPTYVGESNGVQVIVTRAGKPVSDLSPDNLKVVVSTGGQQTGELTFAPGFDPIEMTGPLGEYDAPILPTAPGDYMFHLTGTIHGQAVDETVSSGAETFETVKDTTDLQFPNKLPSMTEIVTRLDRIDSRIAGTQAQSGPTQAAVDAAAAQATDARANADRSLLVGGGLGVVGIVVGALGAVLALRATRRMPA